MKEFDEKWEKVGFVPIPKSLPKVKEVVDENEITAVCGFCDETVVVDEVIIKFEKNTVGIPDCDKTPDDGKSCNF